MSRHVETHLVYHNLSIYLSVCLAIYLCIYPSIHPSIHLSNICKSRAKFLAKGAPMELHIRQLSTHLQPNDCYGAICRCLVPHTSTVLSLPAPPSGPQGRRRPTSPEENRRVPWIHPDHGSTRSLQIQSRSLCRFGEFGTSALHISVIFSVCLRSPSQRVPVDS